VHASTWSQAVRTRMYSCKCPRKHTIHYDGEHLGLYVWSRQTILVQESLQLLIKQMQRGQSGFGALLEGQQEAFRRAPESAVLSEETWRKASLDLFRLVGRQILKCCSICGPHPEVSVKYFGGLKRRSETSIHQPLWFIFILEGHGSTCIKPDCFVDESLKKKAWAKRLYKNTVPVASTGLERHRTSMV
jgi:hypothetical protein